MGWTFQGFIISDWQGIDRITSPPHANYTYSIQASILAGIDMVSHKTQLKISSSHVHGSPIFVFFFLNWLPTIIPISLETFV